MRAGVLDGAHWHFLPSGRSSTVGADPRILDLRDQNGIRYTIHLPTSCLAERVQSYHEMTAAEARAYFEQFMSEMDSSRERLADTLREQGADPGLAYNLTPETLGPMWDALSPLLAWQEGWEPSETLGGPRPTLEALGDLDALPSWVATIGGPIRFSPASIWIIDGVGRHLGNVFVANVPGVQWDVGYHRIRGYVHQNKPVLTRPDADDLNPFEAVTIVASKGLENLGTSTPRDYYERNAPHPQSRMPAPPPAADSTDSTTSSDCDCGEHLAQVAALAVPFADSREAEEPADEPVTVADLVALEALWAEEVEDEPGRWMLWFGDETRLHYDDDAPMSLEDVVALAPGVSEVVREDRETILVRAPGRCEDAMVAVAARALLDDRVRSSVRT